MDRQYRVINKKEPSGESVYVVYQVCYDEQGTVQLVSADPVSPSRETLEELRDDLERIRQALELPVLAGDLVLNSVETSAASVYGTWLGEQLRDCTVQEPPGVTRGAVPPNSRELPETVAERFAAERRKGTLRDEE